MAGQYYYGPGLGEGLAEGVKAGLDAYDRVKRLGLEEEQNQRRNEEFQRRQEEHDASMRKSKHDEGNWANDDKIRGLQVQTAEIQRDSALRGQSKEIMGLESDARNSEFEAARQKHESALWPAQERAAGMTADAAALKLQEDKDAAARDRSIRALKNVRVLLQDGHLDEARDHWNEQHKDSPGDQVIRILKNQDGSFTYMEKDGDARRTTLDEIDRMISATSGAAASAGSDVEKWNWVADNIYGGDKKKAFEAVQRYSATKNPQETILKVYSDIASANPYLKQDDIQRIAKGAMQFLGYFNAQQPAASTGGNAAPSPDSSQGSAPPAALQYLKAHPEAKDAFKAKYGYLPEGY